MKGLFSSTFHRELTSYFTAEEKFVVADKGILAPCILDREFGTTRRRFLIWLPRVISIFLQQGDAALEQGQDWTISLVRGLPAPSRRKIYPSILWPCGFSAASSFDCWGTVEVVQYFSWSGSSQHMTGTCRCSGPECLPGDWVRYRRATVCLLL